MLSGMLMLTVFLVRMVLPLLTLVALFAWARWLRSRPYIPAGVGQIAYVAVIADLLLHYVPFFPRMLGPVPMFVAWLTPCWLLFATYRWHWSARRPQLTGARS